MSEMNARTETNDAKKDMKMMIRYRDDMKMKTTDNIVLIAHIMAAIG